MTRIAIVGAHGKIGQRLIRLIAGRGDEALGVVRKPEQIEDVERLGGTAALVDIEHADARQLADAIAGSQAVVFAAGAGPGSGAARKHTVDYGGSVLTAQAARLAGVGRFVQISAMRVDAPVAADADETWRAYVAAKRAADTALRATDLDWTILRPGGLTDEPGTGLVTLAAETAPGRIPRDDVAALVLAVLDEPRTIGHQWEAVAGSIPVAAAVENAVR